MHALWFDFTLSDSYFLKGVETSCFDGGIRIIGNYGETKKHNSMIHITRVLELCKRECDVMYTYRKKFLLKIKSG